MPWRSLDDRVLEKQPLRSVFVWFLVSLFLLGADADLVVYLGFRFHRFPWSNLPVLAVLGIMSFRFALVIHRRRHHV